MVRTNNLALLFYLNKSSIFEFNVSTFYIIDAATLLQIRVIRILLKENGNQMQNTYLTVKFSSFSTFPPFPKFAFTHDE